MLNIKPNSKITGYEFGSDNYKELTKAFYDKFDGLENMQKNILGILKKLMKFSSDIGIKPVIAYGSALGLEVYNGFIPWDDDYDCTLMYDDVKILLDNEKMLKDKYDLVISSPLRKSGRWPLFKISHTEYKGAFVDILAMMPESKGWGTWWRSRLWMLSVVRFETPIKRGWLQRSISHLSNPFTIILPRKLIFKSLLKRVNKKNTGRVGAPILGSWYKPKTDWVELDYHENIELRKFNGIDIYASKYIKKHLDRKYGSWNNFPDLDKIKMKHKSEWR